MENSEFRITINGMHIATALAAIFCFACTFPLTGPGMTNLRAVPICFVRTVSLFAALGAPFGKARFGARFGSAVFSFLMMLAFLVYLAVP